jgi:PHD/YefM family antitoxin component YafN of YafNO toxin-antitoxin module
MELLTGNTRQFVVNDRGEKVAVMISVEEYEKILEQLEDLEDIRAYDEAKAAGDAAIPLEQALAENRRNRK